MRLRQGRGLAFTGPVASPEQEEAAEDEAGDEVEAEEPTTDGEAEGEGAGWVQGGCG